MWIRTLAVEHWRGLTCRLDALSPGLNLIAGPNESGKSRLVQALRFALFESSSGRSAHKRELATWGLAPGKPRVTVDFELGGTEWHLEKVFLDTGHNTLLRGGGQTLEGEIAEARLGEMLGFTPSSRAELKLEERGLWALLWVDQGASRDLPSHNEASQSRLTDQLSREIGEVAAGDFGQRVLRRAEEYRNRFYSLKRDDERSALSDPRQLVERLRARLAQATARRDQLADAADQLEAARTSQAELEVRLAAAELRHRALGTQLETAQTLRHRLDVTESAVTTTAQAQATAIEKQRAAAALTTEIAALDSTIASDSVARDRTAAARDALQLALEQANQVVTDCDAALVACDTAMAAQRRRQQVSAQRDLLARLREKRSAAQRLHDRMSEVRRSLAPLPTINDKDVKRLRKAEAGRDAARARLEGASVSLTLTAGTDLAIDGQPLASGAVQRLLVIEDRRIAVDGLLIIDVNPGGGEIAGLRDQFRDAERALTQLLESFGVTAVEAAADVAGKRRDLESELTQIGQQLTERVPEGVEALDREVGDLQGALDAAGADATAEYDPAALAELEAKQRNLSRAQADARLERDALSARLATARIELASISSSLEAHRNQHQRLVDARASAPGEADLQAAVETAGRAFGEQVAARDEARRLFDASGGDQAALDLEQAARSLKHLREALQKASNSRIEHETVLRTAGDDGRHEQVQELEAELIDAEVALARVTREAQAARRLYEILNAEYKAARERLTAPVIERIRPYLADLFPGSEVWLDDELTLRGLRSAQTEEHFEALSGGAREQLSLLVRIGLAEVLGAAESWPLVLDDVLVNTDAERIRRMQRALFNAARQMQILLFTCHGPLFDALGPDTFVELPAPRRRETPG